MLLFQSARSPHASSGLLPGHNKRGKSIELQWKAIVAASEPSVMSMTAAAP
jgi:hypothetical protein